MAQGSAPIGLALAGIASVVIISGIQGESIPEVLKGEFGKGTKNPFPGSTSTPASSSASPGTQTQEEPAGGVPAGGAEGTAPPPSTITIPKPGATLPSAKSQRAKELEHGLEVALGRKRVLEQEVKTGRITSKHATELFNKEYPYYATWYNELRRYA